MSKKYKKIRSQRKESLYYIIPFIIAASVVPLIVRIYQINYPTEYIPWYNETIPFFDIYSFAKSRVIVFAALLALMPIGLKIKESPKAFVKDKINILGLILVGLIALSTITSPYLYEAVNGYLERYEGAFVNIGYIVLFLSAYNICWTDKMLSTFFKFFTGLNIILGLIGVGQYFGFDILLNDQFIPLITSLGLSGVKLDTTSMTNYNVIGQTLYHYNYVSFFTTLSFPFLLSKTIYESEIKWRVFYGLASLLILFNLFGSSARSGMVGLMIAVPIWILLNRERLLKNTKTFVIVVIALIAVFIGFETISGGFVTRRLISTFNTPKVINPIQKVYIEDQEIIVQTDVPDIIKFRIPQENRDLTQIEVFVNDSAADNKITKSPTVLTFNDKKYERISMKLQASPEGEIYHTLVTDTVEWHFTYHNNALMLLNMYGNYEDVPYFETLGFYGYEKLGSMRGYIWSRAFPLILDHPILGYGADTFPIIFPQHDYIGKKYAYTSDNMVVDKAHNYLIQQAVSFGIPFALIVLSFWILFIGKSILKLKRSKFKFVNVYESSFFTILIAFTIASMFNDSSVHVSSSYWTLFGIAMSLAFNNTTE